MRYNKKQYPSVLPPVSIINYSIRFDNNKCIFYAKLIAVQNFFICNNNNYIEITKYLNRIQKSYFYPIFLGMVAVLGIGTPETFAQQVAGSANFNINFGPGGTSITTGAGSNAPGGVAEDPVISVNNQSGVTIGSVVISGNPNNQTFYNDNDGQLPQINGAPNPLTTYDGPNTSGATVTTFSARTTYMNNTQSTLDKGTVYFVFPSGSGVIGLASGASTYFGVESLNSQMVIQGLRAYDPNGALIPSLSFGAISGPPPIQVPAAAAGLAGSNPAISPIFDGGILKLDGTPLNIYNFSITPANGTIDLHPAGGAAQTAAIALPIINDTPGTPGGITIASTGGGGALTFSAANTYTGATIINSGATLALTGSGSVANSSGVVANGTFDVSAASSSPVSIKALTGGGNVVLAGNTLQLTNAAGAFGGVISGSGGLGVSAGSQTLTGVNTFTGGTTINPGATLTLAGGGSVAGSITGSSPGSGVLNIGDPAGNSPTSLTLRSANSITNLSALNINPNSSLAVSSGASPVSASTVTNAGVLDMTNAPSSGFSINGNYTQTSVGSLLLNLSSPGGAPTTSSTLSVDGNLSLGGILTYSSATGGSQFYFRGEKFPIINYTGALSGTFSGTSAPVGGYQTAVSYATPGEVDLVLLLPSLSQGQVSQFNNSGSSGLQQSSSGVIANVAHNNIAATASGGVASASGTQATANNLNQAGNTSGVSSPLTLVNGFVASQSFGGPGLNSDSFSQIGGNAIQAAANGIGSAGAVANGNQSGFAGVNSIAIATSNGSAGQIGQSLNQLAASSQSVSNTLQATSAASGASTGGFSGGSNIQSSQASLNTAALVSDGAVSLGLKQSLGGTSVNFTTTNSASASSLATLASSATADAAGLMQATSLLGNTLSAQSASLNLSGGQNGTLNSSMGIGNSISANAPVGQASVAQSTQSTVVGLNQVGVSGALTLGSTVSPFEQTTQNFGALTLNSGNPSLAPGSVTANYLTASSGLANSTISGNPYAGQNVALSVNSTTSSGAMSGSLSQQAATAVVPTLNNVAAAVSTGGSAANLSLSQNQTLAINSANSQAGTYGLALSQNTSAGTQLGAANLQSASGIVSAVISSPLQSTTLVNNLAAIGNMSGGSFSQSTSGSGQTFSNGLSAAGGAAVIIKAAQSGSNGANVVK